MVFAGWRTIVLFAFAEAVTAEDRFVAGWPEWHLTLLVTFVANSIKHLFVATEARTSGVATGISSLFETVSAVFLATEAVTAEDRFVTGWSEWHLARFATLGASSAVHSRSVGTISTTKRAVVTESFFLTKTFSSIKFTHVIII